MTCRLLISDLADVYWAPSGSQHSQFYQANFSHGTFVYSRNIKRSTGRLPQFETFRPGHHLGHFIFVCSFISLSPTLTSPSSPDTPKSSARNDRQFIGMQFNGMKLKLAAILKQICFSMALLCRPNHGGRLRNYFITIHGADLFRERERGSIRGREKRPVIQFISLHLAIRKKSALEHFPLPECFFRTPIELHKSSIANIALLGPN